MSAKLTTAFALVTVIAFLANLGYIQCNPAIASTYDAVYVCLENCVQCKGMLGDWFDASLCAKACHRFKGKFIPDCENIDSISSFLNKL